MSPLQPSPFSRFFSGREFWRGPARSAFLWSALAAVLLILLLPVVFLAVDLIITGGNLRVPLAGGVLEEVGTLTNQGPDRIHGRVPEGEAVFQRRGLLPAVWRNHTRPWGRPLATLYRRIGLLQHNTEALVTLLVAALVLEALRRSCLGRARVQRLRAAQAAEARLRLALHRQALRLEPGDLDGRERDQLLQMFLKDADRLRDVAFQWLEAAGRSPVELLALIMLIVAVHPLLAIQCLIPLAASWYLAQREWMRVQGVRRLARDRADADLRLLTESFQKTQLVRGYGMEDFARDQFEKRLLRYQMTTRILVRNATISSWGYQALTLGVITLVALLIGDKVLRSPEELSPAAGLLFTGLVAGMVWPLETFWQMRNAFPEADLAAGRVYRYLDRIPEVSQAVGANFLQPLSRMLEFEGVKYAMPDQTRLLDGISLAIPAGKQVALIATDTRSAVALASMLPRFIEPQAGQIRIDGNDIAWVTLESLRAEVIYIRGNEPYFTGSVLENLRGGQHDYSLNDAMEAAKIAHAHQFITKLAQGYETIVGEHGEQLTPGQSFRLGLARAVLRKPALLIIEEPSQPLDDDDKSMLDDAYQRLRQDRTVIFLPQRLGTVRRADEIVLLHQGKVYARGPHAELVKKSPLYRHWEYVHFNEFRHQVDQD